MRTIFIGQTDSEHYVWTTSGLYRILNYNYNEQTNQTELFQPEAFEAFIALSLGTEIHPQCINGRYMLFMYLSNDGGEFSTYKSAYIYDLFLKKWGFLKNWEPANADYIGYRAISNVGVYANVLVTQSAEFKALVQNDNGQFIVCSSHLEVASPTFGTVSNITYGKIGFSRLGKTRFGEIRAEMFPYTAYNNDVQIVVHTSEDEHFISIPPIPNSGKGSTYCDCSAKWIDVEFRSEQGFQLSGLEVVGYATSRR
jgi:hypothetical protein